MFWLLLATGLLLFAIVTIPEGARRSRALAQDLERARRITAGLESTNEMLTQRERALRGDPFFTEAVLRTKLKYTRPGEQEIRTGLPAGAALVETPIVASFVPGGAEEKKLPTRVADWALFAASVLLVAGAFILFDHPSTTESRFRAAGARE